MGTRSNIGILEKDGTCRVIYCHWDGYPSHHAPMLLTHYADETTARELVALGNISQLNERVAPNAGEAHSFDALVPDVVVAYHRDRQEPYEGARVCRKETALGQEYAYLFDVATQKWIYTVAYGPGKGARLELASWIPEAAS
jgi:hypothetical protein